MTPASAPPPPPSATQRATPGTRGEGGTAAFEDKPSRTFVTAKYADLSPSHVLPYHPPPLLVGQPLPVTLRTLQSMPSRDANTVVDYFTLSLPSYIAE